ncbi:YrdB family protein [Amycolatopsis cynarae]|uniref:YrdB family protein n=1 Tax=Amycolatopsis cynarae TaxID=2995223 RepID=A0ABY7AVM3_9PSEU|nr:YrdB family protein [Amycolatopsis sp. HUAS 11-8]WAL62977.1 YrdB family protein [Amycolatopsis sp. HUAS 11-8]
MMSTVATDAGMVLSLLLELSVYAATGYWGFTLRKPWPVRWLAGLGVPLLLAIAWGLFAAPRASLPLHGFPRGALDVLWFGTGCAALAGRRRRALAAAFAIVYLVDLAL